MSKIKYLLLTRGFPPPFVGGAGRYLYNIFRFLAEDAVVFTEKSRAPGNSDELPVHFIRRSYIYPFDSAHAPRILRWFQKLRLLVFWAVELVILCLRQRPQCILIGQVYFVGLLGLFLKRVMGLPYIIFVYGEELTKASSNRLAIARTIFRHADAIITISHFSFKLVSEMGVERERIVFAPPGINVNAFEVSDQRALAAFRTKLAPDGYKILLTVGRLTRRKGHAEVIAVLPEVLKTIPQLRYVVAGTDAGEGTKLRLLVEQLGLEQQVVFLGRVPEEELPLLYNACDVFIMANRELPNNDTEGFGIVFLEANAARKPAIGGNAGGAKEAVVDGVSGLLVDADNPEALREAIETLLLDESYARKLGEQGYQRVQAEYGWDHTAAIVRECVEKIING